MSTFDFNDGKGPVPAHRHKNPDGSEGGWVADSVFVSKNAWVSGGAMVYGRSKKSSQMAASFSFIKYSKQCQQQL